MMDFLNGLNDGLFWLSEGVKRAIWQFPYWKTDRGPTVDFSLFLVPLEFSMFMGRDVEADRFS